jgi:hypothetical protein
MNWESLADQAFILTYSLALWNSIIANMQRKFALARKYEHYEHLRNPFLLMTVDFEVQPKILTAGLARTNVN